jgi:hypothetical protein
MKKIAKTKSAPCLILSASSMMCSMDVEVHRIKPGMLRLSLIEDSAKSRRDHFDWKIVEGPDDLITQVGRSLLTNTDWEIAGNVPVRVRPAQEGDAEYLTLCWCNGENRAIGEMLSDFGTDQRTIIKNVFNNLNDSRLCRVAKSYLEWKHKAGGDVEELIATFGALGDEYWWSHVADAPTEKVSTMREGKEVLAKLKFEKLMGMRPLLRSIPR